MEVRRFVSEDLFAENCYVICNDETEEGYIIDPGEGGSRVASFVKGRGITVKYILATHGHIDHVIKARELCDDLGAAFLIHKDDEVLLLALDEQARLFGYKVGARPKADGYLDPKTTFSLGDSLIRVMHTPGHTRGSCCFIVDDEALFTGDTLFAGSVGRTDLFGGSSRDMSRSLLALASLPDKMTVYPGHGDVTTLGQEKISNPFLSFP